MKKIIFSIAWLLTIFLVSCSDDNAVNILSINSFGSKFCRNDAVKVFVSAELEDDSDVSYHWDCDGGTFTNPQGLFENIWKAPNEAGTYEIWCTVKSGKNKETRRTKMEVTDELFYSNFETPYYSEGWSNASMTLAFDATMGNNGAIKLTSSKADGRFARSWGSVPVPFSTQINYAVNTCPNDTCFVEVRFEFSRINSATNYVTQACFTTFPRTGKWEASYTTSDVSLGTTTKHTMGNGTDTGRFKFTKDVFNCIAVSIDKDKKFIVYHRGEKFFESTNLASVQEVYMVSRSGLGIENKVVLFADDLFVFDNGTICTAEPRVR